MYVIEWWIPSAHLPPVHPTVRDTWILSTWCTCMWRDCEGHTVEFGPRGIGKLIEGGDTKQMWLRGNWQFVLSPPETRYQSPSLRLLPSILILSPILSVLSLSSPLLLGFPPWLLHSLHHSPSFCHVWHHTCNKTGRTYTHTLTFFCCMLCNYTKADIHLAWGDGSKQHRVLEASGLWVIEYGQEVVWTSLHEQKHVKLEGVQSGTVDQNEVSSMNFTRKCQQLTLQ